MSSKKRKFSEKSNDEKPLKGLRLINQLSNHNEKRLIIILVNASLETVKVLICLSCNSLGLFAGKVTRP